jgi:hypothetical protein
MHDVVSTIFKALTKKKQIIVPGSFRSNNQLTSIRCSCKANDGN